jgi:hypothetical protein
VYVEEPSLSRIVLHEVRTSPDYPTSTLHELHVRYTSILMRTVREAVAEGDLPADTDAEMVRSMVYGGIEHRMWSILFGRGSIDVETTADRYTDMLLHGLLPVAAAGEAVPAAASTRSARELERRLERLERLMALAPATAAQAASPTANAAPSPVAGSRRRKDPT